MAVFSPEVARLEVTPTLDHARQAAQALMGEGVGQVLLYGSVARGEPHPGSDVDLIALFDDLGNYSARLPLKWRLTQIAETAAGVAIDVHVTDRPEWRVRQRVSASFEAAISSDAICIAERDPIVAVEWRKEIGLPASNSEIALKRLAEMGDAISQMGRNIPRHAFGLPADPDPESLFWERAEARRLRTIGRDACMTIETSLKTVIAVSGQRPRYTHSIAHLLRGSGDRASQLAELLDGVRDNTLRPDFESFDDVGLWRQVESYPGDFPDTDLEYLKRRVPAFVTAALKIAEYTMSEIAADHESDPTISVVQREIDAAKTSVHEHDLLTGYPA